jgi:hypothetical protein
VVVVEEEEMGGDAGVEEEEECGRMRLPLLQACSSLWACSSWLCVGARPLAVS